MTVIGKILTFLCFFVSLICLGFAIQVPRLINDPVEKKSWREVALEKRSEVEKAYSDLRAKDQDLINVREELKKVKDELKQEKTARSTEVDNLDTRLKAAEKRRDEAEAKVKSAQIAANDAVVELNKKREETIALAASLRERELNIATLTAKMTKVENDKIRAEVEAKGYLDRLKSVEKELQVATRDLERLRESRDAAPATTGPGIAAKIPSNPPPENVEGKILDVRPSEGLVEISIGSDDGILRNHTLEVFRLQPKPVYLGTIRIVEVREKYAIGQVMNPQYNKLVQKDDIVASQITPRRRNPID